jgi:hypothetical protein
VHHGAILASDSASSGSRFEKESLAELAFESIHAANFAAILRKRKSAYPNSGLADFCAGFARLWLRPVTVYGEITVSID